MEDMNLHQARVKMSNKCHDNPLNENKIIFIFLFLNNLLDNNSSNHVLSKF